MDHIPLPHEEPNRRRNLDGNAYVPLLDTGKTGVSSHVCTSALTAK